MESRTSSESVNVNVKNPSVAPLWETRCTSLWFSLAGVSWVTVTVAASGIGSSQCDGARRDGVDRGVARTKELHSPGIGFRSRTRNADGLTDQYGKRLGDLFGRCIKGDRTGMHVWTAIATLAYEGEASPGGDWLDVGDLILSRPSRLCVGDLHLGLPRAIGQRIVSQT